MNFQLIFSIFGRARVLMSGTIFFELVMGGAFMSMCNFGFEMVSLWLRLIENSCAYIDLF